MCKKVQNLIIIYTDKPLVNLISIHQNFEHYIQLFTNPNEYKPCYENESVGSHFEYDDPRL